MKKIMRKTFVIGLLMIAFCTQAVTSSAYTKIYETKSPLENYADGLTHQNIQIYTNEGWINMNVLRVDLTKNVEMTVLTDTLLSSKDTITNMVNKNNADKTIVAAINSDFFDTGNSTTMGNLLKDGKLLTTSVGSNDFASFNITSNGLPFVGYINSPNNTISNGVYTKKISYVNKPYLAYNRTIYYDSIYFNKSYGKTLGVDILEMLVIDDKIIEIRRMGEPFAIPKNGYVLSSVGTDISEILKNFKVGEILTMKYDVNFKYMDLSIGGGAQLVKNGQIISPFSQNISGLHPRTALGISKDRKELILVTIDGRTSSFRGVSQTELAYLLIQLGANEAINLDGGGSTQMVSKSPWTNQLTTMNFPSDKVERKMYTALAIEKLISATPILKEVRIDLKSASMLLGSEMSIGLLGSDTNYNPVSIPLQDVIWSVTGVSGSFSNGKFMPTGVGNGIITANYKGFISQQDITVKNNGVKLIVTPAIIKVDTLQDKTLKFSVLTEEGETIEVSQSLVKMIVPTPLGTYNVENGIFSAASQINQGYITCEFSGLKTYVPVVIGVDKQLLADFEKPTATFSSYPQAVAGSYQETRINAKSGLSAQLNYDFSKSSDTRAAYMIFNAPIKLPVDASAIGMWVYGDKGNNHWLRAKVLDAAGAATNISIATNVNWTGWKYVSAQLPTGFVAPFTLERVYLVETDKARLDSGYILVDQIEAVTSQSLSVPLPPQVNRIKTVSDYKLSAELIGNTSKLMNFVYYKDLTQTIDAYMKANKFVWMKPASAYSTQEYSDAFVIKFNNNKGSIRKNGYTQWVKFLNFVSTYAKTKPIIIMMSDVYIFNDPMEHDLLLKQVKSLTDRGVDVAIVFPTSNKTFYVTKTNGATIIKVPKSSEIMTYLSLGVSNNRISFQAK